MICTEQWAQTSLWWICQWFV